jgi:hypothetical protein
MENKLTNDMHTTADMRRRIQPTTNILTSVNFHIDGTEQAASKTKREQKIVGRFIMLNGNQCHSKPAYI